MVMAHEHHIDVQFPEHRGQVIPPLEDVAVHGVAGHGVDGVVEHHDLPGDIGVGGNGLLHECLVFSNRQVVAVQVHEQHIVIHKPVVAAGTGGAEGIRLVGNIEVLAVGI